LLVYFIKFLFILFVVHKFEEAMEQGGDKQFGKTCLEEKMEESKERLNELLQLYRSSRSSKFVFLIT